MSNRDRFPNFYKLQKLAYSMDVAYTVEDYPNLLAELEQTLKSGDTKAYKRLVKHVFQAKLGVIKEIFFKDYDEYFKEPQGLVFSGAITFFTRHPGFTDQSDIRFLHSELENFLADDAQPNRSRRASRSGADPERNGSA